MFLKPSILLKLVAIFTWPWLGAIGFITKAAGESASFSGSFTQLG